MESILQYILIFGALSLVAIGYSILKRKFELGDSHERFMRRILETATFIVDTFDLPYEDSIVQIVRIAYQALDFIEGLGGAQDLYVKKRLIEQKTLEICHEREIDLQDGFVVELVDRITDYMIAQEFEKEIE